MPAALSWSTPAARRSSPRATCGSVNVALDGRFAETAGTVVPADGEIVVVTEPDQDGRKNRLARIGFDRVIGYLDRP